MCDTWQTCQKCHKEAPIIKSSNVDENQINHLLTTPKFLSKPPTAWNLRPSEEVKVEKMNKALKEN